jgi:hypothetical protein
MTKTLTPHGRRIAVVAIAVGLAQANAFAVDGATAPYNEAVKIVNGKRVVEVAPLPSQYRGHEGSFTKPGTAGENTRHSVETKQGLMDCNGVDFYHPKACVPSDYGKAIRARTWTVKMKGAWYSCIGRAKPVECIPLVADGKLRALPYMQE